MVRDTSDDQKLKSLGQPGGRPSTSAASGRSSRTSSSTRGQKSGRSGSRFTLSNFNKRVSKPGSSNRGSRLVSELLHVSPVSESHSSSQVIVGGRVSKFASFWPSLTADFWILEAISLGVRIPFINAPFQSRPGANMSFNSEMRAICDAEVKSLLLKRAIEKIPMEEKCFVSGIFVIHKSSGGFRPIVNLKGLNRFVDHFHFKMEGISVMKGMVRKGDFFTKIDLQDAYLTISIHPEHRMYLQFVWEGALFQFSCLCFCLSSAPWSFTKILKPLVAFLRRKVIPFLIDLTDYCLLG